MAAIEYGSYYWCVMLGSQNGEARDESVHIHADTLSIESGALVFKSVGRRPAGTDPKNPPSDSGNGDRKPKEVSGNKDMIYIAFAPGTWKTVYAAKLQDGSPASVEHWKRGQQEVPMGTGDGAAGNLSHGGAL